MGAAFACGAARIWRSLARTRPQSLVLSSFALACFSSFMVRTGRAHHASVSSPPSPNPALLSLNPLARSSDSHCYGKGRRNQ
eukprot:1402812-Pleurochrysis_carterae.AAC.3